MGFLHDSSSLDHLPLDITLKLSDGSIKANKSMLGIVSPVFKKMLYGSFKEASADEIDLPGDSYKTIKVLFDILFNGGSEIESLDDIIPLMEAVDRYQIKKEPLQHICDEAILDHLDSLSCLTLLQKFIGVMSDSDAELAAHIVLSLCKGDFASKFEETKDLPEEVLFFMLQRNYTYNPEIELFDFLVKWHDYQTKELNKTLKLVPQLFQCIRYFLISPRLLLTKVATCSYVDKQVVMEALDSIYTKPLNKRQCGEGNEQNNTHKIKAPRHFCSIEWNVYGDSKPNMMYKGNICYVQYYNSHRPHGSIISSRPLKNGAYSFSVSRPWEKLFISFYASGADTYLYEIPANGNTFILFVYENDLFVKVTEDGKVRTTHSATGQPPFCVRVNTDSTDTRFFITQTT